MATEDLEIRLQALIDAGNSAKTLGELKANLRQLNDLAVQYGEESPEAFKKASIAAGGVKDRITDIKQATKAVAADPGIERLSGSFALLTNNLEALNFKDATTGVKLLTSSVKELNFVEATSSLKVFAGEMIKLGAALLTNPIFLLGAVIVLIITQFDKLKTAGGLIGKVFQTIGDIISGTIKLLKEFTDFIGLTNFAAKEKAEQTIKNAQAEKDAISQRYDLEINLTKTVGKATEDLEIKKKQSLQRNIQDQIDAIRKIEKINGELTEEQKKQLDDLRKEYQGYTYDIVVLEKEKAQKIIEANKQLSQQIEDLTVKRTKSQVDDINLDRKRRIEEVKKSIGDEKLKEEAIKDINIDADKQIKEYKKQASKDARDKTKTALDKQLSDIQDANKIAILFTEDNTRKRVEITNSGIDKEISFYQEKGRKIGLSEIAVQLKIKELQDQQVKNTKDQAEYEQSLYKDIIDTIKKAGEEQKKKLDAQNAEILSKQIENTTSLLNRLDELQLRRKGQTLDKLKELEISEAAKNRDRQLEAAKGNAELIHQIAIEYAIKEIEITKQTEAQKEAIRKGVIDKSLNYLTEINGILNTSETDRINVAKKRESEQISSITKRYDIEIAAAKKAGKNTIDLENAKEAAIKNVNKTSVRLEKAQFERNKALNTVSAIMNTYEGITAALKKEPPYSYILAAITAAFGFAKVAAIQRQKFEPSEDSSSSSISGSDSGSDGNYVSSIPSFNGPAVFNAGNTQPQNSGNTQPQQVYVLESDITKTQKRVSVIEQRASLFGGV